MYFFEEEFNYPKYLAGGSSARIRPTQRSIKYACSELAIPQRLRDVLKLQQYNLDREHLMKFKRRSSVVQASLK